MIRLPQEEVIGYPMVIEGITTSKLQIVIKLYPKYPNGIVIHAKDVSRTVGVLTKLFSGSKDAYVKTLKSNYELVTKAYNRSESKCYRISLRSH